MPLVKGVKIISNQSQAMEKNHIQLCIDVYLFNVFNSINTKQSSVILVQYANNAICPRFPKICRLHFFPIILRRFPTKIQRVFDYIRTSFNSFNTFLVGIKLVAIYIDILTMRSDASQWGQSLSYLVQGEMWPEWRFLPVIG